MLQLNDLPTLTEQRVLVALYRARQAADVEAGGLQAADILAELQHIVGSKRICASAVSRALTGLDTKGFIVKDGWGTGNIVLQEAGRMLVRILAPSMFRDTFPKGTASWDTDGSGEDR